MVKAFSKPSCGRLALACAAASLAPVIAGCGSSGGSHPGGSRDYASFLRFSNCMRAHGVPNFPDLGSSGGHVPIGPGTGLNPASPAFQSAMAICKKNLPGGGPKLAQLSESDKLRALKFARCMRAHGVPNYPDPNFQAGAPQAPAPPDVNSPAGKRAFKACGGARNAPL